MEVLRKKVNELAKLINAPNQILPTFETSYHFVVVERGQEHQRKRTSDFDEILFWIFDGVTFSMATKIELKNRNENEDFRIQLFKIQEELIGKINQEYKKILEEKHKKLLR